MTSSSTHLEIPEPRLIPVYRLDGEFAGEPLDVGDVGAGHRRIVPLAGGTFTGPALNGKLLPGSNDWQIVLRDGTTLLDIRYTLQTDDGAFLYVQSRGVRQGADPSEYILRTSTQIETGSRDLDWLNKGLFISIGRLRPGGVIWDIYRVE